MQFIVHPEIFERFPGMRLPVAVAHGIDNRSSRPEIEQYWQQTWTNAREAADYGNAQSHPRVQPWRERFRALGVSGKEFPSSIEALLRRALRGGEPFRINPLVDFYNAVSLRHTVPAGGFDLNAIDALLELRLTRPGDTFLALDGDTAIAVPPGEVAYATGNTILTRHFVWRQARTGLVTSETTCVFLVAEVLGEVGLEVAEQVLDDFRSGLERFFGVVPETFLVDERNASASFPVG